MDEQSHNNSEHLAQALDLDLNQIGGVITSFLVDRIRTLPKVWEQMTEYEQTSIIDDAQHASRALVTRTVNAIAADGQPSIPVIVGKVTNDAKQIKADVTLNTHADLRHELFDAAGSSARLVVTDVEKYMGGELPEPDPDEPELPVDGGGQQEAA